MLQGPIYTSSVFISTVDFKKKVSLDCYSTEIFSFHQGANKLLLELFANHCFIPTSMNLILLNISNTPPQGTCWNKKQYSTPKRWRRVMNVADTGFFFFLTNFIHRLKIYNPWIRLFTDLYILLIKVQLRKTYLHIIHTAAYRHRGDQGEMQCASLSAISQP